MEILSQKIQQCKERIKESEKDIFIMLIIVFTAFTSFGLGRLSSLQDKKIPITIENMPANVSNLTKPDDLETPFPSGNGVSKSGMFIASKNGTKYHFPWCPGAQSIKEENKVWFSSEEEAKNAGYAPASNCKGL